MAISAWHSHEVTKAHEEHYRLDFVPFVSS